MPDAVTFQIQGMTCDGCVRSVQRAATRVPGVSAIDVDLTSARAVAHGAFDREALAAALRKAGFTPVFAD
jgi:copper chaperone CopZ